MHEKQVQKVYAEVPTYSSVHPRDAKEVRGLWRVSFAKNSFIYFIQPRLHSPEYVKHVPHFRWNEINQPL